MPDAAQRIGYTSDGLRRTLIQAGVALVRIHAKAVAVEEADLDAFLGLRRNYIGRGRPRKENICEGQEPAAE